MYQALAGAGLQLAGGIMGASAASRRKRQLEAIANTPGIKLGDITADVGESMGGTESLERRRNEFARAELRRMMDETIPGYDEAQAQRTGTAMSLMRGEVPADVQEIISRSAAARAVGGGFGGSAFGRNLAARDLGRTSLDLMSLGQRQFADILASTRQPEMANMGYGTGQILGLRSNERTQKMDAMRQAAMAPGATETYAKMMSDMGGSMMGGGGGFTSIFKGIGLGG